MGDLQTRLEDRRRACPGCGEAYGTDVVVCVACGIDLRTGRRIQTVAETRLAPVEDEAPAEEERSLLVRLLLFVGGLAPGLFRPRVLVLSIVVAVVGLAIMGFGVSILGVGAVIAAVAIMAAGLVVYAQAIAWVLAGGFCLLSEAMVDFDANQWTTFFVIVLLPMLLVLASYGLMQPPG